MSEDPLRRHDRIIARKALRSNEREDGVILPHRFILVDQHGKTQGRVLNVYCAAISIRVGTFLGGNARNTRSKWRVFEIDADGVVVREVGRPELERAILIESSTQTGGEYVPWGSIRSLKERTA